MKTQVHRTPENQIFNCGRYRLKKFLLNASIRGVTGLDTNIEYKLPKENESAILGLADLETKKIIPFTQTCAWNFQKGCMGHWLGTSPDPPINYNDYNQ